MKKRILYFIFLILLVADISYSFMQHLNQPLDGDMAGGIVPAEDVKPILSDPLGISVLSQDTVYPNPNRFFCHWPFYQYFRHAPILLQSFTSPVESIYLSCAIAKTLIQVGIIFILAFYITGKGFRRMEFMAAAVLIAPLYQTNGYRSYMGIIDPAATYAFFYALPAIFLLVYFVPVIKMRFHGRSISESKLMKLLWLLLALVVSLSSALNPGIVLVVSVMFFFVLLMENRNAMKNEGRPFSLWEAIRKIDSRYWFYFVPVVIFSVYSLFLGRYNSVSIEHHVPAIELYARLPKGLFTLLTEKPAFLLLLGSLLINTVLIRLRFANEEGRKILRIFMWIGIFAIIYLLLLPLGGARDYRPDVVRYDTILPVTLLLMFMFGLSVLFLCRQIKGRGRIIYVSIITAVLMAFTFADKPEFEKNDCEKHVLNEIYSLGLQTIPVRVDCAVLSWNKGDAGHTELNTKLLEIWKVIPEETNRK